MATVDPLDPASYAQDEAEAEKRYSQWRSHDPFPEIQPALLNTADLLDYIRVTGMISPFTPDRNRPDELLKPASCAIAMGGEYLFWEQAADLAYGGVKAVAQHEVLSPGDALLLKRNSIVYVALAPAFRIPNYIAARFNLTIENIYRGILVGTGPLVDPGFDGHLFLPLHNLTSNDYRLIVGEPIVWMEFTKLSENEAWNAAYSRPASPATGEDRSGQYIEFPQRKRARKKLLDYTRRASDREIMSSIPSLLGQAQQAAESARNDAARIRNIIATVSVVGVVAIVALAFQVLSALNDARNKQDQQQTQLAQIQNQLAGDNAKIAALEKAVARLKP